MQTQPPANSGAPHYPTADEIAAAMDRRSGTERRSGDDRRDEEPRWYKGTDVARNVAILVTFFLGWAGWEFTQQADISALERDGVRYESSIQALTTQQEADRREIETLLREVKTEMAKLTGLLEGQQRVQAPR